MRISVFIHLDTFAFSCVCLPGNVCRYSSASASLTAHFTTSARRLHDAYTTVQNNHETLARLRSAKIHDVHDAQNNDFCPKIENRYVSRFRRRARRAFSRKRYAAYTFRPVCFSFSGVVLASCRRRAGVVRFLAGKNRLQKNPINPRTYSVFCFRTKRGGPQTLAWLGSQEKRRDAEKSLDFSDAIG